MPTLIVPLVYCWFLKKNIRIKMPAGVPESVTNAFSAAIPAFVILTGAAVIHGICSIEFNTTGMEIIYKVVQTPLPFILLHNKPAVQLSYLKKKNRIVRAAMR